MIKFTLKCDSDHSFESWFQSGDAFDALAAAGHVSCMICGSKDVKKSLMAPRVRPARTVVEQADARPMALSTPQSKAEIAMAEMRKQVEDNSDYVGGKFAKVARDMHLGDAPERSIYGTAGLKEVKALIEDGVPVMPLPFIPKESAN